MTTIETKATNSEKLNDLWNAEQEIMDTIDEFCHEHKLRYSLAYGTLLGAVRHKGFIPWDDDVDMMMPRQDYEKFKKIWQQSSPTGFILQDEDVEPDYSNNFMKIRKDHTTFLQSESERAKTFHKGIFIDVFPGDRQAPGWFTRKIQQCEFALSLLYNRGYTSGNKGVFALGEKLLLSVVPKSKHRKLSIWFGKRSRRWNQMQNNAFIFPVTIKSCRKLYPADMFESKQRIEFRGKRYDAVCDTDRYLSVAYGDYMKLPPESERTWTHHPIVLDFNHNYDELPEKETQRGKNNES